MGYRTDPDLEFLGACTSEDLAPLVSYLTQDSDGDGRFNEGLTDSEEFKANAPHHDKYWKRIAEELQLFGANSFASITRGGDGVLYREILADVCVHQGVGFKKTSTTVEMEASLLEQVMSGSLEAMDDENRRALADKLGLNISGLAGPAATVALQLFIREGGFPRYKQVATAVNQLAKAGLGRGLSPAANRRLMKTVHKFVGPVGFIVTAIFAGVAVAGPAFRVTVPAVIHIAYLRANS